MSNKFAFTRGRYSDNVPAAMAPSKDAFEKLLSGLLTESKVNARRGVERLSSKVSRRNIYECKVCLDTRRIKVPRVRGTTVPCPACVKADGSKDD